MAKRAMMETGCLFGQKLTEELPGVRGGPENLGTEEKAEPNNTGMCMKRSKMPICDRPIKVFGEGAGRRFSVEDAAETNPMGLSQAVAIRYKNSGQSKPNPAIFLAINGLQRKSASFSENMNGAAH